MDVQEIKDDKDDKDDNSFSKGAKEEEKGDTIMNFNIGKNQDKGKILQYNNTDINNVDNQNNFQDSHLKTENKIRLNQDILKQSKISTDKQLIDPNKINNNKNDDKNEEVNDMTFGGIGANFFSKINRCFSDRVIMIITVIMLLFSILLLTFSILDFIKMMKYRENKNYFMNNILFFIFDVINISSILFYHIMNYFLKPKLTHNIIILLILLFVIIGIIRCLQFVKKNDNMFAIIINLSQNFMANLINGLTLFFFFIDSKKRKNAMHGIEEIINFTELNANIKTKKEDGLQLDIESSSKEKPAALVEEEENKGN